MITVHMLVAITLKCDSCGDEILINVPVNKIDNHQFILDTLNDMERYGWDFYGDELYCCRGCYEEKHDAGDIIKKGCEDAPIIKITKSPERMFSIYRCCHCHKTLDKTTVQDGSGNLFHPACVEPFYRNTEYVILMDRGD